MGQLDVVFGTERRWRFFRWNIRMVADRRRDLPERTEHQRRMPRGEGHREYSRRVFEGTSRGSPSERFESFKVRHSDPKSDHAVGNRFRDEFEFDHCTDIVNDTTLTERPVITDEARFDDVDQIIDVIETVLGRHEVPAARAWLQQSLEVPGSWRVVRDESASAGKSSSIVSIAACLPTSIRLGSVSIPAARVDFVATRESHRGRGHASSLVRELLADSDRRGDLVQLTDGLPYFYRQFGFGYALNPPGMVVLPRIGTEDSSSASRGETGSITIRPAVSADMSRIDHYVAACMSGFDIAPGEFASETWFDISEFGSDTDHLIVAESGGAIVGFTRAHRDGDDVLRIQSSYADSPGVACRIHAALAAIRSSGLLALDCGNSVWRDHLAAQGPVIPLPFGISARTPDPVELLRLLRPEFDRRLGVISAPEPDRKLRLSLFTSAIVIEIHGETIADVRSASTVNDPPSPDDVAIAPDWFPALVLGRWGAEELARRVDDVIAGTQPTTLSNLFPALTAHALVDL